MQCAMVKVNETGPSSALILAMSEDVCVGVSGQIEGRASRQKIKSRLRQLGAPFAVEHVVENRL